MAPAPIYLDNAATSFPKPREVGEAMARLLATTALSPGRAAHRYSLASGRVIFQAREAAARLFGCADSSRVVFTANVTESLNLGLMGLLAPGDHVLVTGMEHNSVMRPLHHLEQRLGISVGVLPTSPAGEVDPADIGRLRRANTRLIVVNHVSNVTGAMADLAAIGREKGEALLMVDAAQSAGVFEVRTEEAGIDFLAFTGHKGLLGPTGTGGFVLAPGVLPEPLKYGGTGSHSEREIQPLLLPDRYEAGTPNTLGIAGLAAGIEVIRRTGLEKIRQHELRLTGLFLEGLATIKGASVYGPPASGRRGPVVSFRLASLDVAELALRLEQEFAILTRAGLHCAPLAHRSIHTFPEGTVRVSFGVRNTEAEVAALLAALDRLSRA